MARAPVLMLAQLIEPPLERLENLRSPIGGSPPLGALTSSLSGKSVRGHKFWSNLRVSLNLGTSGELISLDLEGFPEFTVFQGGD